ncbi:MAG: 30S ribosomal protein S8 [Candidatus Pacearchaeota archaeon]
MSQDIIADALNMIQNAKRARKEIVEINRISKLLIEILKIMKKAGAIQRYKINIKGKAVEVTLGEFIKCRAIKPRFTVKKDQVEKYKRRYLPAKNVGTLIITTNDGLKTHEETLNEGLGGSLLAYFY